MMTRNSDAPHQQEQPPSTCIHTHTHTYIYIQQFLPAVPLDFLVDSLEYAHDKLDEVVEQLWSMEENQVADYIEHVIQKAHEMMYNLAGQVEEEEEEEDERRRAWFMRPLPDKYNIVEVQGIPEGTNLDDEQEELMALMKLEAGQPFSERKTELATNRFSLLEAADDLLTIPREEIVEISEVALGAARVLSEFATAFTRKALRLVEKDFPEFKKMKEEEAEEEEAENGGDGDGREQIEEATEEEIAEMYRRRGEEPPPPSTSASSTSLSAAAAPRLVGGMKKTGAGTGGKKGRGSGRSRRSARARARVLWKPLTPQLLAAVKATPGNFKAHPFKTTGSMMILLPVSGPILFFLPGVLVTDHVLQSVYSRYKGECDIVVGNTKQITRLTYVFGKIAVRHSFRVVKHQLKKLEADPVATVKEAGAFAVDAALHPVRTATAALEFGKKSMWYLRGFVDMVKDTVIVR